MALKQPSTLWVIAMTGVSVGAWVSLHEAGLHRPTWITTPVYIGNVLFFPLVALADALSAALRLPFFRTSGLCALGADAAIAIVARLPTADGTPGVLVWTVMGVNTVTNLQALTYSGTVLAVLLAEGLLRALVFPNELAFIQASVRVTKIAAVHAAAVRCTTGRDSELPTPHRRLSRTLIMMPCRPAHRDPAAPSCRTFRPFARNSHGCRPQPALLTQRKRTRKFVFTCKSSCLRAESPAAMASALVLA
jgi:hypothetical protein